MLDRDAVQLFNHPERYFPYLQPVTPTIKEALLTPFYVEGKAVGTVWVIAHDSKRKFDAEDMRLVTSLGVFAASAYQVLESKVVLEREHEELVKADRRKTEFLALLAHELRNPLAPIKNAVQLLSSPIVNAAMAASATGILERQVNHMVRLVNDLLDISRISKGTIELQLVPSALDKIIAQSLETIRPHFNEKQQAISVDIPANIRVNADAQRLAQVFGNLLHNASKFSPRGGRVCITARAQEQEVEVRVADDGVGIVAEELPRIFEMFKQAETSFDRAHGGLGLGLALVKNFVEAHCGTVLAESGGPGQGTHIVVRLPILSNDASIPLAPTAGTHAPARSRRVMIVEDNHDSASSLAQLLALRGHVTCIAHDGAEALEAAAREHFDVILLDIGLPGVDGFEVARQLRAKHGHSATLIALSGWGQKEDRASSSAAGFDAHLVKPLDIDLFDALVSRLAN